MISASGFKHPQSHGNQGDLGPAWPCMGTIFCMQIWRMIQNNSSRCSSCWLMCSHAWVEDQIPGTSHYWVRGYQPTSIFLPFFTCCFIVVLIFLFERRFILHFLNSLFVNRYSFVISTSLGQWCSLDFRSWSSHLRPLWITAKLFNIEQ